MKISIFGLGYVGAVTAGCLTSRGHSIVGVDVHPQKVADFAGGRAPIVEPELDVLLAEAARHDRVQATSSCAEAVASTEVSLVCVGTPSTAAGALELQYVRQVVGELAEAIAAKNSRHAVVIRSTMLPGSTRQLAGEFLADAIAGGRVEVVYFPEFLREGTAVRDFLQPSLVVVGTAEGAAPADFLTPLFGKPNVVRWEVAEMIKYACNAFHATKIAFANEIGRLGKRLGIDGREVMALVCEDRELNISPTYLRPGTPFGGSCLPKDVRALTYCARQSDVEVSLLGHLLASNRQHLEVLMRMIDAAGHDEVAILGLSFKQNTDDLRESPMVEVAQNLLGRGFRVRIFDPQLNLARLVGSNKRVIDERMPHLATHLLSDLSDTLAHQGTVIVAQRCAPLDQLAAGLTSRHHVIDVNGWPELEKRAPSYQGLCW